MVKGPQSSMATVAPAQSERTVRGHLLAVVSGLAAVAVMLVWAVHDGGYDTDTWYWGAIFILALLLVVLASRRARRPSGAQLIALGALGAYAGWSYLSIAWSSSPGDALLGSNRTLLYLLLFTLLAILPWTPGGALAALTVFTGGVGLIGLILLVRMALSLDVQPLFSGGRVIAPTNYYNSTVALFSLSWLTATGLFARRELPGLVRLVMLAVASASLQLAVLGQSRGWLFTLPLVVILTAVLVKDRLRVGLAAAISVAGALVSLHWMLAVYRSSSLSVPIVADAARAALLACLGATAVGLVVLLAERRLRSRSMSARTRRAAGISAVAAALIAVGVAGTAGTHGRPLHYLSRQWQGFSHPPVASGGTHFDTVGSGRYDFWRVSLDAFAAHPVGGVGQDNFGDYYITRRRTDEQPRSSHSLEMSLLSETGLVGFALFAVFLVAAAAAAIRVRRSAFAGAGVAAVSTLPFIVWLAHGSVDWFWEMPAITGPALGMLAIAGAIRGAPETLTSRRAGRLPVPRSVARIAVAVAATAALLVLAFPYLSVREVSTANDIRTENPAQALSDLRIAAELNPLSSEPGKLAGTIALQTVHYRTAQARFAQAIAREPEDWYAWFGAGLAASALDQRAAARAKLRRAAQINAINPAIRQVLQLAGTRRPISPAAALQRLLRVG
jgi:hypothetical protein